MSTKSRFANTKPPTGDICLAPKGADFLLGSGLSLKSCFLVRKSYKDWHGKPFPVRRVCTTRCTWAHPAAQMRFSTFEREVRLCYLPFLCSVGSNKWHLEGHFLGHECLSYWWASTSWYKAEPVVCLLLSSPKRKPPWISPPSHWPRGLVLGQPFFYISPITKQRRVNLLGLNKRQLSSPQIPMRPWLFGWPTTTIILVSVWQHKWVKCEPEAEKGKMIWFVLLINAQS